MNALESALRTLLLADATLLALLDTATSIFLDFVPHGENLPAVTFGQRSGIVDPPTPTEYANMLYAFQGYTDADTGGMAAAGAIQDQLHATLQGATLSVSGWGAFGCYRESHIRLTEVDADGEPTYRAGGVYRIRLRKN